MTPFLLILNVASLMPRLEGYCFVGLVSDLQNWILESHANVIHVAAYGTAQSLSILHFPPPSHCCQSINRDLSRSAIFLNFLVWWQIKRCYKLRD